MHARVVTAILLLSVASAQADDDMGNDDMMGMDYPPRPLGLSAARDASGTSWQPESTPMFMWHTTACCWELGLHLNAFIGYDAQSGTRGDDKFVSMNWLMAMARHELGDGDLTLRAMLSLEPATVGDNGYPLLLQTGETLDGKAIHDRQHPHDLFMELAARYRGALTNSVGLELYAAPVGEPAIGPPAFPHRFAAMADPFAPLGHHWEDATHISFGVLTAGVFTRWFKIEGSWFNGREPDEHRWDFDLDTPDSFAARLTVNPDRNTSAQVSWARLDKPEALEPGVSVQRITGSVLWNRRIADGAADLSLGAVVGHNEPSSGRGTNAALVEGSLMFAHVHTAFARAELVSKTGHDLALPDELAKRRFGMASLSVGYVFDFDQVPVIVPGIGVAGMLDIVSDGLQPFYGTRTPLGGMVFVRIGAPEMRHDMASMHHHHMSDPDVPDLRDVRDPRDLPDPRDIRDPRGDVKDPREM